MHIQTDSILWGVRDREVACLALDRQGSNFESCVCRAVSSHSFHHSQEVLPAQFSLYCQQLELMFSKGGIDNSQCSCRCSGGSETVKHYCIDCPMQSGLEQKYWKNHINKPMISIPQQFLILYYKVLTNEIAILKLFKQSVNIFLILADSHQYFHR